MPAVGYDRVTGLLAGTEAELAINEPDHDAVSYVQEIIRCHGYRKVPGRKNAVVPAVSGGEIFGIYGKFTGRAVQAFKKKYNAAHSTAKLSSGIAATTVDSQTLQALIDWTYNQTTPGAGRIYIDKVLSRTYGQWEKMSALVSTFEESINDGGFTAQSPKAQSWSGTSGDEAGLSYGLFQFTHQSGRLNDLLLTFRALNTSLFDQTFRVPGTTIAGLFDHLGNFTAQTNHGIATAAHAAYSLFDPKWKKCFANAGRILDYQATQLDTAITSLKGSYNKMKVTAGGYATALANERGIGFWLDLCNQVGDSRGKTRYQEVITALGTGATQAQILDYVVDHSSFPERRIYFRDQAPLTATNDPFAGP